MVFLDHSHEAQQVQKSHYESESDNSLTQLQQRLATLYNLSNKEGSHHTTLRLGPTYYLRTSGNIDLSIRSIFTEYLNAIDSYILVATSAQGLVVGFRDSRILQGMDGEWMSKGYIFSAIRGKGIATAIDSAHKDFLQRASNKYRHSITWRTYNGNAGKLYLEQRKFKEKHPDALSADKLEAKKIEQNRWQALWGSSGKFGASQLDGITFPVQYSRRTQDVINEDLVGIEAIYMSRDNAGIFRPVEIERAIRAEDISILSEKKNNIFKEYLVNGMFEW